MERKDILQAAERIRPMIVRTPVQTSSVLDALSGAHLFFKCENFQKGGAFKFRGATNAILQLEKSRGVATHSSGNHALAVTLAAQFKGLSAHVVMPHNTPDTKKRAVEAAGAQVTYCEPLIVAREAALAEIVERSGADFIPPYDHPHIIAGQGTAALELLEDHPELDTLIAPVGGGGLISGTSLASGGRTVIGAEPELADDAFRSLRDGVLHAQLPPLTIADGLRGVLSALTFGIIREHVQGIVRVSEEEILAAMKLIRTHLGLRVEPSSATVLAAVLKTDLRGKKVGLILSGGNVDFDAHIC